MNIAIVGFGSQGKSALAYLNTPENNLTVCDVNHDLVLPEGVTAHTGPDYLDGIEKYDLVVRSPSIHPRELSSVALEKVTTNTNLFFRDCPTRNIIGVTGTKGKGTTSTLIAKMLEAAGKRVHLGGNIGIPPLELLKEDIKPDDWVVLELANFQTIDLAYSPHIAVCLMIVPEHLDWHSDYEEYKAAKKQLFANQTSEDIAVYYADNEASEEVADVSAGTKIAYFSNDGAHLENNEIVIGGEVICKTAEVKLLGAHNLQNVCAAITAVWHVTRNIDAIRSVITTFTGLEHRLEFVRELEGVAYYDDSFGTTPETAMVAIDAFAKPKIIILGGSDKGAKYNELVKKVIEGNVRYVVAIGDTGPDVIHTLQKYDSENRVGYTLLQGKTTMAEIVEAARTQAEPGDVVLLSTGCASFGLFKDYKDRGEQFKSAVLALS